MAPLPVLVPHVGPLPAGPRNTITDVAGVTVGHCTLDDGAVQTGVTVVRPHPGDPFRERVPAAAAVINGFGKSVGLVQVDELGLLDTPIALTNTFSVPAVAAAQIRQCIAANPETGRRLQTVNPLVLECNDGYLNDIQRMAVTEAHYLKAHDGAGLDVPQGAVGAGRGMGCFGAKGGIGTASRRTPAGHTLGALVLSNFGKPGQCTLAGHALGAALAPALAAATAPAVPAGPDKGSIILLLATDAPLDARQLRRVALRAGAGLARTGSVFGHASGDIALAFSTAYTLPLIQGTAPHTAAPMPALLRDDALDDLFQAAADATEQAILHSMWHATTVRGRDGHVRPSLRDLLGPDPFGLLPAAQQP